ncbi:MAG: hypothetical protein QXL25_02890, partial [Candidatus Bathyarchaeia archaeon]
EEKNVIGGGSIMNPTEIYILIQSLMTFIIVTDIFYERIIQNKLMRRLTLRRKLVECDRPPGDGKKTNLILPKMGLEHNER